MVMWWGCLRAEQNLGAAKGLGWGKGATSASGELKVKLKFEGKFGSQTCSS